VERLRSEYEFEAEWKGFEIHPEFPPEGLPRERFGGPYMRVVEENVRRLAAESGLVMHSPDPLANTHLALQAAEFARESGYFEAFHERLFVLYFHEGRNIGDREVLRSAAREVGLDVEQLDEALDTGRYEPRLAEVRRQVTEMGMNGVPAFLMEGIWLVGVQPDELMRRLVERAGAQKRLA
jgi:predicted DsbA family dithiol-disulfide isomerase